MRAMGVSIHTGWGACVVVGGTLGSPKIFANELVHVLDDPERFCFHAAAEMTRAKAEERIARMRDKALANARRALSPKMMQNVRVCALVAKEGEVGDLDHALATHSRIHAAEGCFYRDVFRDACPVATRLIHPSLLDPSKVGRLAPAPWGRDQKIAALAAWTILG